jgi:hypothetical protein
MVKCNINFNFLFFHASLTRQLLQRAQGRKIIVTQYGAYRKMDRLKLCGKVAGNTRSSAINQRVSAIHNDIVLA